MTLSFRRIISITCMFILVAGIGAFAQDSPADKPKKKKDKAEDKIKPYDEVITEKMTSDAGLFLVHRDGDDVYFEIPVDQLGIGMIWVTQLAETQAGFSWAGMPVSSRTVRWEQRGDRILLRGVRYDIRSSIDDPIQLAVEATSVAPIIRVFDVVAYGKDKAPVIKVSSMFTSDPSEFSAKELLGAKSADSKRSFVESVKSFPTNIETRVLMTYSLKQDRGSDTPTRRFPSAIRRDSTQSGVTVVLHHSMVRLPDEPMTPRVFDDRVGFFTERFTDFGDDSDHETKRVRYIARWRLEKKKPKAKVSEPVKPIIWYVSREVPKKWQPYVIQGINSWQPAFEAAGFKNAIIGKLAPTATEDPDWDPEDARYTTVRWLPSGIPNAFGPHISDPRTGEILEADVRMFHNVIKLVRDWYFVQASASDPRAQKLPMPDDLMGELIGFVVAHEVGHSLGFPHNMKASSSYTTAQLRDAEFTTRMGTAPSIMDYARFNYVAQPGDNAALLPQVGVYDFFAVEWGYRQFKDDTEEQVELAKIVARQVDDPMLRFGNPNPREDPTQQTEDLGANAVEATALGIQNLERIAAYLVDATSAPSKDYTILANMHGAMLGQWRREMVHVANVVGGVERQNLYYGDADQQYFPIESEKQRTAVTFLNDHAFTTPTMFLNPDVMGRIGASGAADQLLAAQRSVLNALIDSNRITRMSEAAQANPDAAYRPADMLADVTSGIWSELDSPGDAIDLYRRNLQRAHVAVLTDRLGSADDRGDMPALARRELVRILANAESRQDGADETTNSHLHDIVARITFDLERVKVTQDSAGTATGRRRTAF